MKRLFGKRKGVSALDVEIQAAEPARDAHSVRETEAASDGVCRSPEQAITPQETPTLPESSSPSPETSAPNASADHTDGTPAPMPEQTGVAAPARSARLRRWELRQE